MLPVFVLKNPMGSLTATSLGAIRDSRSRGTCDCHFHRGIRLTVDPVFAERSFGSLSATSLGAIQESRNRGTCDCHFHIGVRLTIGPENQQVRAES